MVSALKSIRSSRFWYPCSILAHLPLRIGFDDEGLSRAELGTFAAQGALDRFLPARVHHHNVPRAGLDAFQAGGAFRFFDPVNAVNQLNRVNGAGLGAGTALIADMDPIVAGRRESPLDAQQGFGRVDLSEIFQGADLPADPAAGAVRVDSRQLHH
jgi:hypothetical protein